MANKLYYKLKITYLLLCLLYVDMVDIINKN